MNVIDRPEVSPPDHAWAVILAGGEGSRLRGMTVDDAGGHVPKQFCRIGGQHTLLELALSRASRLVDLDHVVASVTEAHKPWWTPQLRRLSAENIISQPANRGTAFGILLPLLSILKRDPRASIVFIPADHFVADEQELAEAARRAVTVCATHSGTLALIGVEPDSAEGDYGYILTGRSLASGNRPAAAGSGNRSPRRVRRFVEKPESGAARLIEQGALWNTFIFAARGSTLLRMFERRMESWASLLWGGVSQIDLDAPELFQSLTDLYNRFPTKDFSRDILAKESESLAVVPAANCGWSDLGNPRRVIAWLQDRDIVPEPVNDLSPAAGGGHLRVLGSELSFQPGLAGMTTTA